MCDKQIQFQKFPDYPFELLPPGIHKMTESELDGIFVKSFPESNTRQTIAKKFAEFRFIIQSFFPSFKRADGSFVEEKENPKDVDVVFFVSISDLENSTDLQKSELL
jgi:hypothetical protein